MFDLRERKSGTYDDKNENCFGLSYNPNSEEIFSVEAFMFEYEKCSY